MSRRKKTYKKEIELDPKFKDKVLSKFIKICHRILADSPNFMLGMKFADKDCVSGAISAFDKFYEIVIRSQNSREFVSKINLRKSLQIAPDRRPKLLKF